MGKSKYDFELLFENSAIETKDHLKILGIKLDNKLSFQEHIKDILNIVYAKIGALTHKTLSTKEHNDSSLQKLYSASFRILQSSFHWSYKNVK